MSKQSNPRELSVPARILQPTRLSVIERRAPKLPTDESTRATEINKLKKRQLNRQNRNVVPPQPVLAPKKRAAEDSVTELADRLRRINPVRKLKLVQVGDVKVELQHELGSGGFSSVYSAFEPISKKNYALKIVELHNVHPKQIKQNLVDEVELLKMLKGVDHVVQLVSCQVNSTEIRMLMEQATSDLGKILFDSRDKDQRLDIQFVRYWGGQVLNAVAAVHEHNIVHSDIKPGNFLVVRGRLKLCDFGIASKVPAKSTCVARSVRIGTCNYMAPETHKEHVNPTPVKVNANSNSNTNTNTNAASNAASSNASNANTNTNANAAASSLASSGISFPESYAALSAKLARKPKISFSDQLLCFKKLRDKEIEAEASSIPVDTTIYKVSKASDVWSCGVILYEMVYMCNPVDKFLRKFKPTELENCKIDHPKIGKGGAPVPLSLHEVIRSCLQIDPENRNTAAEAARSLFFQPISVDDRAVKSILKSGALYGIDLGKEGKPMEDSYLDKQAKTMYAKLYALNNGAPPQ